MILINYMRRFLSTFTKSRFTAAVTMLVVVTALNSGCQNTAGPAGDKAAVLQTKNGTDQGKKDDAAAMPAGYNGPLQGKVTSKAGAVFKKTDDLEASIKKASLGQLSLEYEASDATGAKTIELPKEAMDALNEYFRAKLEHRLVENDPKIGPSQNVKRDSMLLIESSRAGIAVMKADIEAPDGKRKISQVESARLIEFVSKKGVELGAPARIGA